MPRLGVGNWKGPLNKFRTFCPLICGGKWRGMPRLTWVNPAAPLMPNFLAPMSASIANKTCSHFHALPMLCSASTQPLNLLLPTSLLAENAKLGLWSEHRSQTMHLDDSNNWVTKFWRFFFEREFRPHCLFGVCESIEWGRDWLTFTIYNIARIPKAVQSHFILSLISKSEVSNL